MEKALTPFSWFLLLLPLVCLETGCSERVTLDQPLITASPAMLDFGKVRPIDSPIKLTFDIDNNSNTSIALTDIPSGCVNSAMMRTISIIPVDTSVTPLSVPLYCHREE